MLQNHDYLWSLSNIIYIYVAYDCQYFGNHVLHSLLMEFYKWIFILCDFTFNQIVRGEESKRLSGDTTWPYDINYTFAELQEYSYRY